MDHFNTPQLFHLDWRNMLIKLRWQVVDNLDMLCMIFVHKQQVP